MSTVLLERPASRAAGIADRKRRLLLVGAVEDHSAPSVFSQFQLPMERASSCGEALLLIRRDLHRVVVSERDLPDGNWKDVLEAAAARENPPVVIVTSWLADDYLWAEVLNLGGYDVLAKPFNREEVQRTVSLAWQHWQNRHEMRHRNCGAKRSS